MNRIVRLRQRARELRRWWACTAWFQFAHKPLCSRFAGDVLRVGRWRLCRSCTWLYSGLAASAVALAWGRLPSSVILTLLLALFPSVLVLSYPTLYRRMGRAMRDAIRCATGVTLSLWCALLLSNQVILAAAIGAVALSLAVIYNRQRQRVRHSICNGCPELGQRGVCSGFSRQAVSVRAYCHTIEKELNRADLAPSAVVSLDIINREATACLNG